MDCFKAYFFGLCEGMLAVGKVVGVVGGIVLTGKKIAKA